MELPHTSKPIHQVSTFNHVLEHCIHIDCLSCFVCQVEVEPEPEAAPFVEDPEIEPRQQGKQTPLIMSIKSYFPLSIAYACLGDHRDTFFRIVEPIPMHDLSFCHRIKQTTILADLGVE